MGDPTHDPHGDPIPTASGKMMAQAGRPLTTMTPDERLCIVHFENEPQAVYAQLVAEGLHLINNFALCNGRWPPRTLIASLFIGGALVPAYLSGLVSALAVMGVVLLGVLLTFILSWALSRTWLKGQVSTFSLELPPTDRLRFCRPFTP